MQQTTTLVLLSCLLTVWAGALTQLNMETTRLDPAIATTGNLILVAGGNTQSGDGSTALVSVFSISARRFIQPANLTRPRRFLVGLSFPNTVFFIDTNTSEVERYNPSTNSFTTISIPGLAVPFAAASVNNKAVFVSQGFNGIVYNVDTGLALPTQLCSSNCEQRGFGIATAVFQNQVFFAGGGSAGSRRVDIYNDGTGSFSSSSQALSIPRSYLKSAVTSSRVVFAGGPLIEPYDITTPCATQSVIDVYNPQARTWTTATLNQPKFDFGMASADGEWVLFAEGITCDAVRTTTNSTLVFNANTLTFGPSLQTRGTGYNVVGFTTSSKAVFVGGGLNQYQPLIEVFSHTQRVESFDGGLDSDFATLARDGEGYVAGGLVTRPTSSFFIVNV